MFKKKKNKRKKNRYVGKLPVNSRITIDYTKKKPSVKFSYPRKNSAYQVIMAGPTLFPALILTMLAVIVLQGMTHDILPAVDYPEMDNCDSYLIHPKGETYATGLDLECMIDGKLYVMKTKIVRGTKIWFFKDPPKLFSDQPITDNHAELLKGVIGALGILFMFPFFIWLLYMFYTRTKLGQRIFPEIGKSLGDSRYYTKFDKVPKNKQIEIPLFKNIYLDYSAKKGFSKNLLKMEIVEHPFNQIVRKTRRGKEKITKTLKQVYLWKAVFYFKQIPKDGSLEVWWT